MAAVRRIGAVPPDRAVIVLAVLGTRRRRRGIEARLRRRDAHDDPVREHAGWRVWILADDRDALGVLWNLLPDHRRRDIVTVARELDRDRTVRAERGRSDDESQLGWIFVDRHVRA